MLCDMLCGTEPWKGHGDVKVLCDLAKVFHVSQSTSRSVLQHGNHNNGVHTPVGKVHRTLKLASNIDIKSVL